MNEGGIKDIALEAHGLVQQVKDVREALDILEGRIKYFYDISRLVPSDIYDTRLESKHRKTIEEYHNLIMARNEEIARLIKAPQLIIKRLEKDLTIIRRNRNAWKKKCIKLTRDAAPQLKTSTAN
jgi:hypothetical protein